MPPLAGVMTWCRRAPDIHAAKLWGHKTTTPTPAYTHGVVVARRLVQRRFPRMRDRRGSEAAPRPMAPPPPPTSTSRCRRHVVHRQPTTMPAKGVHPPWGSGSWRGPRPCGLVGICRGAGLPGARGWLRGGPGRSRRRPTAGGEIGGGHGGGTAARPVLHPSQHNQLGEFVSEPGPGCLEGSAVSSFMSPRIVTDALVLNTRVVVVERISISTSRSSALAPDQRPPEG